ADVAATGDGGEVVQELEQAEVGQPLEQAEVEGGAADAAAGERQADQPPLAGPLRRRAPVAGRRAALAQPLPPGVDLGQLVAEDALERRRVRQPVGVPRQRLGHGVSPACAGRAAGQPPASARITSLAFSLTMYTGVTIKKPGMRGNTEASTTRRPRAPRTRKSPSSTAPGSPSLPILQVPQAWWPQASRRTCSATA